MCPACTVPLDCISVSLTLRLVSVPDAPAIEVAWTGFPHVLPCDVSFDRHHVGRVSLSRSLDHHITCLSVYSITTVSAQCIPCRPLLWLFLCPSIVATACHLLPGEVGRPLSGCFFSFSCLLRSTSSRRLCMVSFMDCSFVLHYFIMLQVKTLVLIEHRCYARWRQDLFPSRFTDPVHAT